MTAHAEKPDFVFRAKRTSPFKSALWGRQFSRLLAVRGVCISGSNAGYTVFRGSVKGTGYPLRSPVSPPVLLQCFTVCQQVSTRLYRYVLLNMKPGLVNSKGPHFRGNNRSVGSVFTSQNGVKFEKTNLFSSPKL